MITHRFLSHFTAYREEAANSASAIRYLHQLCISRINRLKGENPLETQLFNLTKYVELLVSVTMH
jgi:hypothetical protein